MEQRKKGSASMETAIQRLNRWMSGFMETPLYEDYQESEGFSDQEWWDTWAEITRACNSHDALLETRIDGEGYLV